MRLEKKLCDGAAWCRHHAGSQRGAAVVASANPVASATASVTAADTASSNLTTQPPLVPPQIAQYFVPLPARRRPGRARLSPTVLGLATVHFSDKKLALDGGRDPSVGWLVFTPRPARSDATGPRPSKRNSPMTIWKSSRPSKPGTASLPAEGSNAKSVTTWQKAFADAVYRLSKLDLMKQARCVDEVSKPDESERDFRIRLQQAGASSVTPCSRSCVKSTHPSSELEERIRRGSRKCARKERSPGRRVADQDLVRRDDPGRGARPRVSARRTVARQSAARGVGRTMEQSADVTEAEESVDSLQAQQGTRQELQAETTAAQAKSDPLTETFEIVSLRPKKADIAVRLTALAWLPQWQDGSGTSKPAWE